MLLSNLRDIGQPLIAALGKSHAETPFHHARAPKTPPEKHPGLELPAESLSLIVQGTSREIWVLSVRSCWGSASLRWWSSLCGI